MSDSRWRSPLAHRDPLAAGKDVRLAETPFLGLHILRGELAEIGGAARDALGCELPSEAGATASGADVSIMWLSPDEWLLVDPEIEAGAAKNLAKALAGRHHQLTDVSDYYTAIEIGGERARELLSKLLVIDLHPSAFEPGRAVATVLAKANIWLWLGEEDTGPNQQFRVIIRRSMAEYAWDLLIDAAREWGPLTPRPRIPAPPKAHD